jgi:hypothetical protein
MSERHGDRDRVIVIGRLLRTVGITSNDALTLALKRERSSRCATTATQHHRDHNQQYDADPRRRVVTR